MHRKDRDLKTPLAPTNSRLAVLAELRTAAIDEKFAEWVREAVRRFVMDYDFLDAACNQLVIRKYWNLYQDWVAENSRGGEEPVWADASAEQVENAMREDFASKPTFREAANWLRNGSRCLSCGRDVEGKPIDLATLTEDARRTLVALFLMASGDSVLLVAEPPDWDAWRKSGERVQYSIAWMVDALQLLPHDRFERIDLVVQRVLAEWAKVKAAGSQSSSHSNGSDTGTENRSVAEETSPSGRGDAKPTIKEARNLLGEQLVENFDLRMIKNLALQEEANDLIEKLKLPLEPYDSDSGNGVAQLYKRSYSKKHGKIWDGDGRGRKKKANSEIAK